MDITTLLGVLVLSGMLGMYIHEAGHWFVGWLGRTGPTMEFVWFIPNGVRHAEIETVDPAVIRASGFINFLWAPPWILASIISITQLNPVNLFAIFVPFFIILGSTESDAIAFRNPERYRQMEIDEDFPRNPLFLPNRLFPDWLPRV